MKMINLHLLILLSLGLVGKWSYSADKEVDYNDRPLNISGDVDEEEEEVADDELNYINNELSKQKRQLKLNKEKTRNYKKLSKTTEKLSNSTEDYIQEKKESEKIIKEYNKKIKCLLEENYGNPDCDEYVEKKQEDKVKVIQAATEQVVEDLEKNKETGFADKFQ